MNIRFSAATLSPQQILARPNIVKPGTVVKLAAGEASRYYAIDARSQTGQAFGRPVVNILEDFQAQQGQVATELSLVV